MTEQLTPEELSELQQARVQALKDNYDPDCEVCNSEWFQNIDYTNLTPVTKEEQEEFARNLWASFTDEEKEEFAFADPHKK